MPQKLNRWPARMDLLQSGTGLLLVMFIWGHMFFESSILLGHEAMYWVTRMFEGEHLFGRPYPLLVSAAAAIVLLLIALHALLALRKFPANYRQYQRMNTHMAAMRHMDTTLWYVQVITGFLLFFLASAHLLVVLVQPDNIGPYASSDRIWSGRFWILYASLLLVVHVHAGIGIYRLAMKWGPFSAASSGLWRGRIRLALYCIVAFYLCLGTASLITYMRIGAEHAPYAGERYVPTHASGAH
ncbi:fumarate reductase cytochrome b subunit [Pseudohalioglobus lutimaris]|uniref:Succinate dehydrogenase/fumarate reductase cytochrome b subunit n=1 Tax=Pseudohalioglobus lutimaris TaxID=1737061 RepID=A0A2N5WY55_9GAMM|nr:fumarate reductase cytochrome b subunit [Pseudohalioglobus lutimaris]PLW67173.1 succinate dehydrogenase/fumarate reductase cytochrome b subunit [Pseudohalioglobus lutimaris]